MRALWDDIIRPAGAPLMRMHLRGMRVDEQARDTLRFQANEQKQDYATQVTTLASEYTGGLVQPTPSFERCSEHPDYMGLTVRRACGVCAEIYRAKKEWKASKAVKRALRLSDFNPQSKDHVGWLLFEALGFPVGERTETGRPKVALAVLEELHEGCADERVGVLEALVGLSHAIKRLSVDLNPPIEADGRVHPYYTLEGTSIGRVRSGSQHFDADKSDDSDFNAQNIPELVRRIYIPDDGYVLVELDAAQIEWVLMMLLARCSRGVEAYAEMRDVHTENAREVVSPLLLEHDWEALTSEEQKRDRRVTKGFTHGLDYGEGVRNLARRFGVSERQAKVARDTYLTRKWPEIGKWQEEVEQTVVETRALRNPFGRIRRFLDVTGAKRGGRSILVLDSKQRKQALAFGPASANADLWKVCLRMLYDQGFDILTGTHDSFLLQCRESEVDETIRVAMELCESEIPELAELNGGKAWKPRFEVKIGRNWGPVAMEGNPEGMVGVG